MHTIVLLSIVCGIKFSCAHPKQKEDAKKLAYVVSAGHLPYIVYGGMNPSHHRMCWGGGDYILSNSFIVLFFHLPNWCPWGLHHTFLFWGGVWFVVFVDIATVCL